MILRPRMSQLFSVTWETWSNGSSLVTFRWFPSSTKKDYLKITPRDCQSTLSRESLAIISNTIPNKSKLLSPLRKTKRWESLLHLCRNRTTWSSLSIRSRRGPKRPLKAKIIRKLRTMINIKKNILSLFCHNWFWFSTLTDAFWKCLDTQLCKERLLKF